MNRFICRSDSGVDVFVMYIVDVSSPALTCAEDVGRAQFVVMVQQAGPVLLLVFLQIMSLQFTFAVEVFPKTLRELRHIHVYIGIRKDKAFSNTFLLHATHD
jgi:hypothetical protein